MHFIVYKWGYNELSFWQIFLFFTVLHSLRDLFQRTDIGSKPLDVRPLEVMMKPLPSPINLFNNLQGLANKIDYRITTTVTVAPIRNLSIPMHSVASAEVAELTKIVENAHRFLQIAFAEECIYIVNQTTSGFKN